MADETPDKTPGDAAEARPPVAATGRPGQREILVGAAHLAGLWAIAMVQPLFDVLGNSPEFFVARGNTAGDILILVFAFAVLPPLIFLAAEWLAALGGRKPYRAVHLTLIAVIAAVFSVQIQKQVFSEPTALMIAIGLGLGALLAYGVYRARAVKAALDVLAFAPIVVIGLFVFFSGISALVLPQEEARALGGDIREDVPVVFVVFDELPTATLIDENDEIRADRYPGFAELASESTWYLNNTTVADFSGRAVPAILTGNNPTGDLLPIAADQPLNLFTLLGGDYDLHVSESLTQLCPPQLCGETDLTEERTQAGRLTDLYRDLRYVLGRVVLPPAIANTLPNVSTTFGDFGLTDDSIEDHKRAGQFVGANFEPPSPEDMAAFFSEIPEHGRALSLIHMELPHEPFRLAPDGTIYNHTEVSNLNTANAAYWAVGPDGVASAEQRHQLQTGYADTLVQAMIDRLKSTGVWDEALVVVTADHGVQFDDGITRRIANEENFGGVANSPLFIKYPGQEQGEVSLRHSRTVDIVPTVADVLGVTQMYETEGTSLLDADPESQITVRNAPGEMVLGEVEEMVAQRDAMVRQTADRLGDGGIFELGPRPELLGREVPDASGEEIEFHTPDLWDEVSLDAERLPLFVTGMTSPAVEPGTDLAIAVNGEVAATTKVFLFEEVASFGAVVPPRFLRDGYNSIGVFAAGPDGDLEPLGGNSP